MFSLRRATQAVTACSLANPSALSSCFGQCRSVFTEKARAGMLVKYDKRIWRIASVTKAQKGQGAATFHVKLNELDSERKKEMSSVAASFDFPEVRYERVKFLFSGYDDDDNACFVYPQHSSKSGQEVNLPASKLKEQHQQFLAVGMPVDMLHIGGEDEDDTKEVWTELNIPTNYEYTVEGFTMKGVYKMANLKECDGVVSVSDNIQPGDKIRITLRTDGKAAFSQKL
jgi:translation elongation factor P/translation initiation factor 5A